jgi:hypothetical protein
MPCRDVIAWCRDRSPRWRESLGAPAALIFILLVCFYGFCNPGHVGSPDEEQLILQTQSLMHGRFTIEIPKDAVGVVSARRLADGRLVPIRGLGQSIVAAPLYAVGRIASAPVNGAQRAAVFRFFLLFTNAFVTAATAAVLYALCRELCASVRGSTLVALAYGLGTLAWPHATVFFTEPLSALLVTASFTLMLVGARRRRLDLILLAGVVGGAAPFSRATNAMFVPIFALALWLDVSLREKPSLSRSLRMPIAFCIGAASTLGVWLLTNALRYGSPLDFGYPAGQFTSPVLVGLKGYVVSPSRSLFLHAPIVLLALAALPVAFRRRAAVPAAVLVAVIANMVLFALSRDPWGGNGWGPRFLDITLPILVALAAYVIDRVPWRRAAVGLMIVGVAINSLGIAIFANAYYTYADGKLTKSGHPPHAYIVKTRDDWSWAPIVGHARLLGDALRATGRRIDGHDPSIWKFPAATNTRVTWYASQLQLNVWWAWWLPEGAPPIFLFLAPVLLAYTVAAAILLVRRTRKVSPEHGETSMPGSPPPSRQ